MAVTVKDVANLAGVTPVVVSRVLHNKANTVRVSETTAARVRKAAEDLGYRANSLARNFRNRRTETIGILHGVGFGRPYFSQESLYFAMLMDGFVEGAFEHGFGITLCPKLYGSPMDSLDDGRFDGLVWYSTTNTPANVEMLLECRLPIVAVHSHPQTFQNRFPTVICDNRQGIGLAVDHLVGLGHRQIGFLGEDDPVTTELLEREDAFAHHLRRHGLEFRPEGSITRVARRFEAYEEYVARPELPSAVVCQYDHVAVQLLRAAEKHGILVPQQLSIVGFDSSLSCESVRPRLTSVRQPLVAMGERAVELLVRKIREEDAVPAETLFPCSLDVRGSTTTPQSSALRNQS